MYRIAILGTICLCVCSGATHKVTDAEVQRVHRGTLLIDSHNDVTSLTVDGFDIGSSGSDSDTDIARLRAGGVGRSSSPPTSTRNM